MDFLLRIFGIIAGILCIVAAKEDWDWFFDSPKAKFFVDHFGREGARKFYYVLGVIILVLGIFILFS
ncbi:MAG: immunity 17 family protein [Firmicutes bacterium]|nr:immunity 17 family protein [Bacillota bacterium]